MEEQLIISDLNSAKSELSALHFSWTNTILECSWVLVTYAMIDGLVIYFTY